MFKKKHLKEATNVASVVLISIVVGLFIVGTIKKLSRIKREINLQKSTEKSVEEKIQDINERRGRRVTETTPAKPVVKSGKKVVGAKTVIFCTQFGEEIFRKEMEVVPIASEEVFVYDNQFYRISRVYKNLEGGHKVFLKRILGRVE